MCVIGYYNNYSLEFRRLQNERVWSKVSARNRTGLQYSIDWLIFLHGEGFVISNTFFIGTSIILHSSLGSRAAVVNWTRRDKSAPNSISKIDVSDQSNVHRNMIYKKKKKYDYDFIKRNLSLYKLWHIDNRSQLKMEIVFRDIDATAEGKDEEEEKEKRKNKCRRQLIFLFLKKL